jgi:hypothetical protein
MSEVSEDRIVLRQSWLGTLSKCPEQARQIWEGVAVETDSSYTMLGTAVHSGIEQCLSAYIDTGVHLDRDSTIDAATGHWKDHEGDIVRWHHKPEAALDVIQKNTAVWWDEVRPDIRPIAVEYSFELPLVPDHKPEIWLKGTIDCVQEFPNPIVDWKNPSRKPNDAWEKKRWSVQAAAYTWAIASMADQGFGEPLLFELVHLVKGTVHRMTLDFGPAEWASLVALARSAGTLLAADLPVWPLRMEGWHCAPKWCAAWNSCRGRFAGPDPWNQL